MNAAQAIRRLEEAGFSHQQATGVVEVVQGEVIDKVATRDYVGEQTALGPKELAEQFGGLHRDLREFRIELLGAINRQTVWMNGFLAALLVAVLGLAGVLIGKL